MKKWIIAFFLLSSLGLYAQRPGGGRPPGQGDGNRPPRERRQTRPDATIGIMRLPDIPGLTDEQREKLTKTLSDEQKDIEKINQKREDYRIQIENPSLSEKAKANGQKLMEKQDKKAEKTRVKYDKKYRKILTEEQYDFFITNWKEIEFRRPSRGNGRPAGVDSGQRPPQGQGQR